MNAQSKTRVVVADDSATLREQLVEILSSEPSIEVVGTATNGREAVELTKRLRPNIVVMDISMPVLDGFGATTEIMVDTPTPVIIVSSNLDVYEARVSMYALGAGAVGVLPKPAGPSDPDFDIVCRQFVSTVKTLGQIKVLPRTRTVPGAVARLNDHVPTQVIAMATAVGGPVCLHQLLSKLPVYFSAPILVVQRVAPGFLSDLVESLDAGSVLRVKIAEHGEQLVPHTVYFAPDHRHLLVSERHTIALDDGPPVDGLRPSGRLLFESVAAVYGEQAAAIVLTEMDPSERAGLQALQAAGGRVVARNPDDNALGVVWEVPTDLAIEDGAAPLNTAPASVLPAVPAELTRILFNEA